MFTFSNDWYKIKHYLRNNLSNLKVEVNIYSLRSSIIVNNGLYKRIFNITVNRTNCIAIMGNVALKSNKPPGPITSELKISVEKLTI